MEVGGAGGRHDAFIHEIARDPGLPAEERGVGTALLHEGLAAARGPHGRGVGVVQLLVDIGNTDAITWYRARGFRAITAYTREDNTACASEVPGAQAIYEPSWEPGRRRGMPWRPRQLCMQADGAVLQQRLQAPRAAGQASHTQVYGPGRAGELRGSTVWAAVTALVDAAHCIARGVARGGSGARAKDLMPQGKGEERTVYVLIHARPGPLGPGPGSGPNPGPSPSPEAGRDANPRPISSPGPNPSPGPGPSPNPTPRWEEETDIDRELEAEREIADELRAAQPSPGPGDPAAAELSHEAELEAAMQAAEAQGGTHACPGSPGDSSPASTPPPSLPTSRSTSRAASPAMPRPVSPTAARWEELVRADCTEGDEDEMVAPMVERLLTAHKEGEARHERRRALQARAALNTRKGFTHWLRVGDIDGVALGAIHMRHRASEGRRGGRARASEEGAGPKPRPLGLAGRCPGCRREGGCTPGQVVLGECRCARVDWDTYGTALAKALRGVEKLVPATALDRDTPLAAWCECRRVVRAAAEAAEGRAQGEAVGAASWEAVRLVLSGLLPACKAAGELGEREHKKLEAAVARAVVRAQEVVIAMLHEYRESTREARAAKQAELEAWWSEERRRRTLRARVLKGLRTLGRARGRERKRLREALADAVVGAQAAAAEGGRRKTARLGGEAARTRAGGLHRVGAYAQIERKRDMPIEWEAGDVKRSRAAGVKQGRGAGRKADGTLDRRLKANRAGRGGEAGGEDGEGDGCSGGGGGGGGGIGPDRQPPPPPPLPPWQVRSGGGWRHRDGRRGR